MSKPKRQRTVVAAIRDRATGFAAFTSIRVERSRITLNPTPGIVFPPIDLMDVDAVPPFDRLEARALRLGQLLQRRWFTDGE